MLVAAIGAFGVGTSLQAQVSVGYRAGLGIFHMKPSDSGTSVLGPSLAIPVEFAISQNFAIQPEVGYAMKGLEEEGGGGAHFETRLNYGDFILLGKYKYGND